jgi:hypothetical protein
MNEDELAYEHYMDPGNLAPSGPAHVRQSKALTGLVPVRFSQETILAVRHYADQDGVTVSSWIRRLVADELQRRHPPVTASAFDDVITVVWEDSPNTPSTATQSSNCALAS